MSVRIHRLNFIYSCIKYFILIYILKFVDTLRIIRSLKNNFFFEETKMKYINNGEGRSLVQVVLKTPTRQPKCQAYIYK